MTLIGATYPTDSDTYDAATQDVETARVFGLIPQLRAWRVFRSPSQALPSWTSAAMTAIPTHVSIVLSSKLESTIEALPAHVAAMPPERPPLWYSYWHESDNWKSPTDTKGDLDPDTWYARWQRLLNLAAAMPPEQRQRLLLGPIYTDWAMTHDPNWAARWERVCALPGVDFVGVDTYNIGYPDLRTPEEMFGPALAVARRYGLPLVVAEWGQTDRGDPTATAAMIRRHYEFLAAQPDVLIACWFYNHGNRLDDRPEALAELRRIAEEAQMPTYAQLQAEPYWGREVVTPAMDWLGDELCQRTGRPREAAGTKGDRYHLRGAHRSQEWIKRSVYCTNRTYTVQSGLTAEQERHIAGFDFTPGSAEEMVAQCKRIYAAMRAGQLDEVREFYGNVDGDQVVDGWDNVRDRAATSDSSHLWHWHLSIDRAHCNDQKLMERILAVALGQPNGEDDDMPTAAEIAEAVWSHPFGSAGLNVAPQAAREWLKSALGAERAALAARSAVATLRTEVADGFGRDLVDEAQVAGQLAPALLAVLTPEAIVAAIPGELAEQVADVLAARLAS